MKRYAFLINIYAKAWIFMSQHKEACMSWSFVSWHVIYHDYHGVCHICMSTWINPCAWHELRSIYSNILKQHNMIYCSYLYTLNITLWWILYSLFANLRSYSNPQTYVVLHKSFSELCGALQNLLRPSHLVLYKFSQTYIMLNKSYQCTTLVSMQRLSICAGKHRDFSYIMVLGLFTTWNEYTVYSYITLLTESGSYQVSW